MDGTLFFLIIFLAILIHSLAGFGFALILMPLLSDQMGLGVSAPLVALIGLVVHLILIVLYRHALQLGEIRRLTVASLLTIPLGVWALPRIDEAYALGGLGLIIAGYALYGLAGRRLPRLTGSGWAYCFGALGGLLGGAFNTAGPAVIAYGDCRRWSPAAFRGNLQGYFLVIGVVVILTHVEAGNYDGMIGRYALIALPAIGLGIWSGTQLDPYLDPSRFRRLTLLLLLVLGFRLLLTV